MKHPTRWRVLTVLAALLLSSVAATAQEPPFRPVLAYSPEAQAVRIAAALRLDAERLLDEGQGEEARQRWLAAIESYRQAGYPPGEIELLFQIGVSYQRDAVSNPEAMTQSAQYLRQGMVAAGSFMTDVASRAVAVDRGPFDEPDRLLQRAVGLAARGNCGEAQALFVEAGRRYAAAGSPLGELRSLTGRLRCLPEIEDSLAAMNLMTTLLDFQRLGEKLKGKVDAGHWMRYLRAVDDLASGRSLAAEAALRSTLRKFEQIGDVTHAAQAALDLGCLLQATGRPDEAGVSYQRAARWLTGLCDPDALWNRVAAEHNLANLSALAVELPTSQPPPPAHLESEPAMESDPIETVAGLSPRALERRRAAFLLGEGDHLDRAGQVKKARAKWLAAASAAERAGDASSRAEAYRRLAYSSISGRVTGADFGLEYMDYLIRSMMAQSEDVEPLLRKRWKGDAADLAATDQAWSKADALVRSGACDQALSRLQQVRSRYRRLEFSLGELRCMLSRLRCFAKPESVPMAMVTLLEVIPLLDEAFANDPQKELEGSAEALASEGKSSAAKALYDEAICRAEKAGDPDALAGSLVGLARVQVNLKELADAETNLERALGLLPFVDSTNGEVRAAAAHEHLGAVRFAQGREAEANEEFERARELIQQAGDPAREVVSLQRLAMQLGGIDSVRALSILDEAEALASRLSAEPEVAGDFCMIRGLILFTQGNLQSALGATFDAERIYAAVNTPFRHGLALNLISSLHAFLGRSGEAARVAAATDRSAESDFNRNVQDMLRLWSLLQADRFEEAAALARENVAFWQKVGYRDGESLARTLLAACQMELGDRAATEREIEAATALVNPTATDGTTSPMQGVAATLIGLMKVKLQAEELSDTARREAGEGGQLDGRRDQELRADLGRAIQAQLQSLQSVQAPLNLPDLGTGGLRSIERLIAGDPAGALESIGRSISSMERLGRSLTVSELRAPFYDRLSRLFDMGVDMSLLAARPDEAFRRAEEARARAFIDQLGNQRIDPGRGDAKLVERERRLRFQLADRQKRLREEQGKTLEVQSVDRLEVLQRSVEQYQREWEEVVLQLKTTNPDYAALITVAPLKLEEVQTRALDDETSLVEYYVSGSGGGRVLAWAIDRESFVMVQLPVTAGELKSRVAELRDRIAAQQPVEAELAELHRLLFEPVAPHVRHRNLIIVPHGVLHFLPFAALRQGKRCLGDAYVLAYAPSATALNLARQRTAVAAGPILALGNPNGSLPHAATEARAVARLYGAEPLLGGAATEEAVVAHAGQAGILHLAAHALLNPLNPLFTRIELAPDGAHDGNLEMHEVFSLDLSRTGLVVLSGCRTQLGELSAGDEIEGLTRAFLYAGTPAVVSSLWDVEDDSTAFLMERFYAHLRGGAGRAEALGSAQRETRKRFPHPYHWAAFVLTGDGR